MLRIKGYRQKKHNRKMEQLSECQTLLARIRNLLEERGIDIPPSIQEGIDEQLSQYETYLDTKIEAEKRNLEGDLESVERTIEMFEEEGELEPIQDLRKLKNGINRRIQHFQSLSGEEVLADPDWT